MDNNFSAYITNYKKLLKEVFRNRFDDEFSVDRMLTKEELDKIMGETPLSVAIPAEYGGRGAKVKECLAVLSAASYESLDLSLTFGINIALFLEPVAKYGREEVKERVFKNFLDRKQMGGLMITEPDYGSDALNMQTWNQKFDHSYKIKGTKHWQGLTGMADYWLVTSRNKDENGNLSRDIDIFVSEESKTDQKIVVEKLYNNLGLKLIPYGLNKIDIVVPKENKLIPKTSGIKMLLDILHRSRLQFPGMAMGFVKRMLDDSIKHCNNRIVSKKKLIDLDQVKYQIAQIQSAFTMISAMCHHSSTMSGIDQELSGEGIQANIMKALSTDLMHLSSQTFTQLSGANGYRMNNIGGRGIMDSRAFQIFEGSNEMLYSQIGEMMIKLMRRKKEFNIYNFFEKYPLADKAASFFKNEINFNLSLGLNQRKLVDLGRMLSRIIASNYVLDLGKKGFRQDLVKQCLENMKVEISSFVGSFHANNKTIPIEDYKENSQWFGFV